MPIRVGCPKCTAVLNAPDAAAGKTVTCPKCAAPMQLPQPDAEFDVVENRAASKRSGRKPPLDDDYEERPRSRKRRDNDEDYDDRDARRRRDRDEERSIPMPAIIGGGACVLILLVMAGLWIGGVFSSKKGSAANASGAPRKDSDGNFAFNGGNGEPQGPPKKPYTKGDPPPGWAFVDGTRFACFLPGTPTNTMPLTMVDETPPPDGRPRPQRDFDYEGWTYHDHQARNEYQIYAYEFSTRTPGTTQATLMKDFKEFSHLHDIDAPWYEIFKYSFKNVNGLARLTVTFNKKLNWVNDGKGPVNEVEKENQTFHTGIAIAHGKRLYIITISKHGGHISDADLKTLLDSFEER